MPEVTQWGRSCTVQVGDVRVEVQPNQENLRVAFVVDRELGEVPPKAEIAIWGLSEATRDKLEQQPELPCSIDAGYQDSTSNLFVGFLRRSESVREGADWIFRASVADDVAKEETKKQKARLTFKEGTSLADVLKGLVKAAGLKPGNSGLLGVPFVSELKLSSGTDKLEKSLSVYGEALDELAYFCRSIGVIWSIEDNAFKGQIAGTFVSLGPLITKDTGLIEPQPRINEKGHVIGTCLLLPELRPGVGFTVGSRRVNGQFICVQTKHSGDTHSPSDWKTEWRGVPPGGFGAVLSERYRFAAQP
jgi:hypothetical protein